MERSTTRADAWAYSVGAVASGSRSLDLRAALFDLSIAPNQTALDRHRTFQSIGEIERRYVIGTNPQTGDTGS